MLSRTTAQPAGEKGKRPQATTGVGGSAAALAEKGKTSKPEADTGKNKLTLAQRLKLVKETQKGMQRSKVAPNYGAGKSYVTK